LEGEAEPFRLVKRLNLPDKLFAEIKSAFDVNALIFG
jgi:hypothetical protein